MNAASSNRRSPFFRWLLRGAVVLGTTITMAAGAAPAFADESHFRGSLGGGLSGTVLAAGLISLAVVFAVLVGWRRILDRRVAAVGAAAAGGAPMGYREAIRGFSPNAKLFLAYALLAELGSGIWSVMFNLYLLAVGFPISFVGAFWFINMLCHGIGALPAGMIGDRFGRRRAFVIATLVAVTAELGLLFTMEPLLIICLAAVSGFGDAFHGVTGTPFMMDNSEAHERAHLFSIHGSFQQVSRFVGNLSGGWLPLAWALVIGIPDVDPNVARIALISGLPLTVLALTPLAFMREKELEFVGSLKDLVLLRNVTHMDIVVRFTLLSVMTGAAFGLTIRFFNVFFNQGLGASGSEVGTILAMGSVAGSASILVAPLMVQSWGKVKSLVFTQLASIPFLLAMAFVPSMSFVTGMFLARGAISSIGRPLSNQLQMEFIDRNERGTTAGFTHTAFDIGGGIGAGLAGMLVLDGDFSVTFGAAALLIAVPAILYYTWFYRLERGERAEAPVTAPALA
ncbi:MAG TPA: MFS transporter [Chloroflexota bacterium]